MVTCLGTLSAVATGTAFCTSPACEEPPTDHDTFYHACTHVSDGSDIRCCTAAAKDGKSAETLAVPRRSCSEGLTSGAIPLVYSAFPTLPFGGSESARARLSCASAVYSTPRSGAFNVVMKTSRYREQRSGVSTARIDGLNP